MENLKPAKKMSGGIRIPHKQRTAETPNTPLQTLRQTKTATINGKIARMPEISFIKLREVISHGIKTFSERLVRDVWCNREVYRQFREDKTAWLMRTLFRPSDELRIMVKDDLYNYLMRTYKERGIQLIMSFLDSIDSCLVERKANEPETSAVFNGTRFREALEYFGLEGERISFATIRKAYTEREGDAAANEHYMYLRDNYTAYLQSIGVSTI
jgi:hypothetical protein